MHGRSRSDRAKEKALLSSDPAARMVMKEKLKRFQAQSKQFFSVPESQRVNDEVLDMLLRASPDMESVWNTRRQNLMLELETIQEDTVTNKRNELLQQELMFTAGIIKEKNVKSYCTWFHRRWCLQYLAPVDRHALEEFLSGELMLCDELLKRDERNFHCWGYRNRVVEILDPQGNADFGKSQELIEKNLGNGSAWQLRSKFLDLHPDAFDAKLELNLVHNAIFTEPADQSPWMYYRFLLGRFNFSEHDLLKELDLIARLLEEEGEASKWPLLGCVQVMSLLPPTDECIARIHEKLGKLLDVDVMHRNFYKHVMDVLEKNGDIRGVVLMGRLSRDDKRRRDD